MEIVLLMVFFRPTAAFFTAVGDPKLGPKFSVADLQSDLLTRVDWLSESVKDKTATVGIKTNNIFFHYWKLPGCQHYWQGSLLWLFDLIPRSIKCLRGTGVITNQLCNCPLGGWRTFHKNKIKGFQGDLLSNRLVYELMIRPFHRAIYWFAQVFSHSLGALRCCSSSTVVSSQPSTHSAGVLLLPWLSILWSSTLSVKYLARSRLQR